MGRKHIEEQTPDLFPTEGARGPSSNKVEELKKSRTRRPALPKDLPTAIKYLNNADLDRLLQAATEEARRRGRLIPKPDTQNKIDSPSAKPYLKEKTVPARQSPARTVAPPLTRGQMNAVQAAFKAGITPSRIARQFGLSQSQVRKALSSDEPI